MNSIKAGDRVFIVSDVDPTEDNPLEWNREDFEAVAISDEEGVLWAVDLRDNHIEKGVAVLVRKAVHGDKSPGFCATWPEALAAAAAEQAEYGRACLLFAERVRQAIAQTDGEESK